MATRVTTVRDYIVSTTYRKQELRGRNWAELRANEFSTDPSRVRIAAARPIPLLEESFRGSSPFSPEKRTLRTVTIDGSSLPPTPDDSLGRFADVLRGKRPRGLPPSPERLALILKFASTPLSWKPSNGASTSQHRGIPSPASLFTTELYVLGRRSPGGAVEAYRHWPHYQLLERVGGAPILERILGSAALAFVVVGHLSHCVGRYGEFSPCLVTLEAGMMQAQLAFLCSAAGWHTASRAELFGEDVRAALGLRHWSQLPMVIMAVESPGAADALGGIDLIRTKVAEFDAPLAEVELFPRMKKLIHAIMSGPLDPASEICCGAQPGGAPLPSPKLCDGFDPAGLGDLSVGDVVRARSSGSGEGLAPIHRRLTLRDLKAILGCALRLHRLDEGSDLKKVDLSVLLSIEYGDDGLDGGYIVDLRTGSIARMCEAGSRNHKTTRASHAGRERSLVATLAVDDVRELRRFGPKAFAMTQLAAGAFAQKLCLAAAARGLTARPIRAYSDIFVNTALPLEKRVIFQVVCCFERRASLAFDLV